MKKITNSILTICLILSAFSLKAQTFTNYTTSNGLPHNNVNCLVSDGAGNMWFGTNSGIAKFDGSTWAYFTTTSHTGLADNTITAIMVAANGDIWAGTDFGVSVFDGSTYTTYTTTDGLGNNRINHIAQAINGDIWLGDFSGATKYDGSAFTAYGTGAGLPFGGISYVSFDSNDDVYMANGLFGFIKYDGSTFTTYNEANDGLKSNSVRSIAIDAADNKWVGTSEGISVFNSSNVLVTQHTIMLVLPAPDTLNPVEDIKIDSQGNVWTGIYVDYLGTAGGVATHTGGSNWTDYDVSDGLVGPVIRKIAIDGSDNIWVGTSTGVSKISFITGIDDEAITSSKAFSFYPNPTSNNITIKLTKEGKKGEGIVFYNSMMQEVMLFDEISDNEMISLDDLERGIYFVKHGTQIEKVIVQ
ncbi:T9SS type A sorting domain-containing protein [Vicingaceae bacterium]|nr:T9SS type A sorting domain-containing protein [Vicingaceae bacterium]